MNFKVLLKKEEDADATRIYIDVIKDAITEAFGVENIKKVYSVSDVTVDDILIIISPQVVLKNRQFLKPRQKFIFWFQGVVPEEIVYLYGNIYARLKAAIFNRTEAFVLRKAQLIFFVSEKLRQHYKSKHRYKGDNYIIMPCFNQRIDESCFTASKYEKPTFVYAGNMSKWQCVDESIGLFSKIKEKLPEASLTILTADQDEAQALLSKHNIEAELKYVPLDKLSVEMGKYKYGFLLRDDILINNVATPTKMNSYMASGVIPIFSDVIGDFKDVFSSLKHIVISGKDDYNSSIEQIVKIEEQGVDAGEILNEYRGIFNTYYSRDAYISRIAEKLLSAFPQ